MTDPTGRRVLVTGASSGIGAATCRALVANGAKVAMLARRSERLNELSGQLGAHTVGITCDVTDLEALPASIDRAVDTLGGLDAVVVRARSARVRAVGPRALRTRPPPPPARA